ncbi:response regulator transcription factor [Lachnotalea glycerini]|uniref:Stage 0 sporulation protein A homolog n=1 Tax=Lachnotalea glycerini TaxID=1763509 RepID=A0A371JIZ5_9FIRM|nr:response regulator [Lachnotalea glycerini]RDY32687.1 response regulator [Lachnotalea glycerini]
MAKIIYKVLIADDEYWTREKLRTMIDWKQYNIEFLEPAVDGEDVLRKVKENTPDILITDINMPFMNGVDLIKILKEEYTDIIIFVISGYDNFDYVKSTLLAGAINYLLKPVTKIDLVNSLSKALEIISNKRQKEKKQEEQKNEILKASSFIQDRELSLLVEKEETAYSPTIMMNSKIDFAGCSLILIKIHNLKELMMQYHYDMNQLSYSIKKKIKDVTRYENLLIFNHIFRSNEFIIITELEESKLRIMANQILNYFKVYQETLISIVISEHSYSIESIHTAYIETITMLMTRKYMKNSVMILCEKDNSSIKSDVNNQMSEELENKLKNLLRTRNQSAVKELIFETVGLRYCDINGWSFLEVKQTVKRVCNVFVDYISEEKSPRKIIDMENMIDLAIKTVENLVVENLCEVLEEMIDTITDLKVEAEIGSIRSVVKLCVKYIDNNFFEELTLTSLANKFNVESSYFSKIFRQEIGSNLMLYIAQKRIDKAKEYMIDSKINLTEIAFIVGYDDYTYFNRVFRKMTGVSPREYRNKLKKCQED